MGKYRPYARYKDPRVEGMGPVPVHWEISRLKSVTRLNYGDSLGLEDRIDGAFDVYGSGGIVGKHNEANTFGPTIVIGRKGSYGSLFFSRTPCFAIDTTYYIDSKLTEGNLKWLYYTLSVLELSKLSQDTGVPGLSRVYAYNKNISIPPQAEQKVISNFLDHKTLEIDGLITDKERLITLLQEYRQSVINETVTKGLDPDVKMKDSGVEWIGEIPEHWQLTKMKNIVDVRDGTHETPPYVVEGDNTIPLVTSKNILNGKIDLSSAKHISYEDYVEINKRSNVALGDIVMPMIGTVGNAAIVDIKNKRFSIKNVALFKTSSSYNLRESVLYFLGSEMVRTQFHLLIQGGVQNFISLGRLRNLVTLMVPDRELGVIASYLDQKTTEIDTLVSGIQDSITQLKSYRQSLISEAVTGKIDVREFGEGVDTNS